MANLNDMEVRLQAAVADAMEALGINRNDLAKKAYVSRSTVDNALTGKAKLSAGMWKALCKALGLDYDQITAPLPEDEQQAVEAECAKGAAKSEPVVLVTAEKSPEPGLPYAHAGTMPQRLNLTFEELVKCELPKKVEINCPRSSLAELGKYIQAKLYADIEAGMKPSPRNLYAILDAWMAIMTAAQTEEQRGQQPKRFRRGRRRRYLTMCRPCDGLDGNVAGDRALHAGTRWIYLQAEASVGRHIRLARDPRRQNRRSSGAARSVKDRCGPLGALSGRSSTGERRPYKPQAAGSTPAVRILGDFSPEGTSLPSAKSAAGG